MSSLVGFVARLLCMWRLVLCIGLLWPAMASAVGLPSTYAGCANRSATVAWGGVVNVDLSTCHFFGLGVVSTEPTHGTATPGDPAPTDSYNYNHNGSSPAGGGTDTFVVLDDNSDYITVTVTIQAPTSSITVNPATLPTMSAGTPFSQTLTSSGGLAPYTYTLQSGALPLGLTLSSAGLLSGTPTERGGYGFTVRSTDATTPTAQFADKGYSGTVNPAPLSITPTTATAGQNAAFSQTLAISGGVAPHTCQLESGTFPAGISVSSTCVVSGTTAAAPGNYPVTIRVSDSSTGVGTHFELESFTLTVASLPSVSIAVSPASVSEDGATSLVYTVTRSLSLSSPTVVNITTSGTATSGVDYTGGVATVTIPAGSTIATITIDPTVDGTVEPNETVTLTVAAGSGYTVGAPSSATGTILNDDVPIATIAVSPASVAEDGAPNLVYTVTLNQASFSAVSIGYTIGGTATNGTDYAAIASPLVIPAGSTFGTITVNPTADATIEADETVTITLAAGAGYTVGVPNSATGTILNDDLPNLTINDVTAAEGNSGTTNFTFTVSLSAPAGPGGVSFDIATANGSATAGSDYVAQSLTGQTIPAGSSTYTFTVAVNGDTLNEANETFFVNVTGVSGAVVVDGQGVGTITNDDAVPSLAINDVSVVEGNSGTTNAVFTVTLSAASGQTVTVNYATADGTATQPADYTSASGTLTFTAGQTTRTIIVVVNGDTTTEPDETFFVNLSGAVNATIADNQGLGTITNDDSPVVVSPPILPGGTVATAYSQTFTATGTAPYTFSVTAGGLPAGLTLLPSGVLSGTPTAGGAFNFTVRATDSSTAPGPHTGAQAYTLTIAAPTVSLAPTTLANATRSQAYSASIAATGGTAPHRYAVTAGALPPGLTLSTAGALSGAATATGTFNFTITATDSSTGSGPYTGSHAYALAVVDPVVVIAPAALPAASPYYAYSAYSQAFTATGAQGPYSFAVTAGTLPPGLTLNAAGTLSGTLGAPGTHNFTITATDATAAGAGGPFTASQAYTLVVQMGQIYSGPSPTGGGTITASFTGGGASCVFTHAQFIPLTGHAASPPAQSAPAGVQFPYGLFDFATTGCTPGSTLQFTITYPGTLPGHTQYWKYGPTPASATPQWYTVATGVSGAVLTFSITDGALGDDDLAANGAVVDAGGAGIGAAATAVPLSGALAWWLALGMAGLAGLRLRARHR